MKKRFQRLSKTKKKVKMKIKEIIENLNLNEFKGLQLTKKRGALNSTWLLYKKDEFYYYFDINQKIEFIGPYKYSEKELIDELENANFDIDLSIN